MPVPRPADISLYYGLFTFVTGLSRVWQNNGTMMAARRLGIQMTMEAVMVREWVEMAGFVLVIAACYMFVIPV